MPVTLKKGNNKVLVKIGQGSGDWTVSFRTTDRDGRPVVLSRKPDAATRSVVPKTR